MNGFAETSVADREPLFAVAISPRPIGLASKRAADVIVAAFGIVLLAPFFIICCVATVCFSPGPGVVPPRTGRVQWKALQVFEVSHDGC